MINIKNCQKNVFYVYLNLYFFITKKLEIKFGEIHETISDINECCFEKRYNGESKKWVIRNTSYKLLYKSVCLYEVLFGGDTC